MVIFPLAADQTIAQMWSNGARGGNLLLTNASTKRYFFVNWVSFAVMSNVVCNENSAFNLHIDIRPQIVCKLCSKVKVNHETNYLNCFQWRNGTTGVNY